MRIVIAPDKFAGTLTAPQAADAIAGGWRRLRPATRTELCPMSDGGPGFIDSLAGSTGGKLREVSVQGPNGQQLIAQVLLTDQTAYVEAAQACGLAHADRAAAEHATTLGVGQLLAAALDTGASEIVVGLGGSATTDGGAGLLAALGATYEPSDALTRGAAGLETLTKLDIDPVRAALGNVTVTAATDVDNPLLGLRGAANVFGKQKGIAADRILATDAALERYVALINGGAAVANQKGSGAAGGLGFALNLFGAHRVPGVELVADLVGLADAIQPADLVISGEGSFDATSRGGKVVYGVAQMAGKAGIPCIVIAGQVGVGRREMRAMGIESAYSLVDFYGEERAFGDPYEALAQAAERVARTWG